MERSEPSLIPEWLKGAAGAGVTASPLSQPGLYQDDAGSSFLLRQRALPAVGGTQVDCDSPRASGSASSDRVIFPSSRRGTGSSNSSIERVSVDRENFIQGRSYSGFTHNPSIRSHDSAECDGDGSRGESLWSDRDWDREGDKDSWPRERDRSLGSGADVRERERERLENGMLRLSIARLSGKYDSDPLLRRSQSMSLSPRIPDNNMRKMNEVVNVTSAMASVSGGFATSIQKAAFERNFPSLGTDERVGVRPMSPGNAPVSSPRPVWQGSSRTDLGRASLPGLTGGFGVSISTASSSISGGADLWSSALAEAPSSNGNVLSNGSAVHILPVSTAGLTSYASLGPGSAASVNAMNMAEALTQNPPRVRTPPQLSVENQRLEELALKQSRQLIPMIPSLPKTMGLADKAKTKSLRSMDGVISSSSKGNQPSGLLQLNSPHRSLTPARLDMPKVSQGKLLVLKSSKDGGTTVSSCPKSDGSNVSPVASHGNVALSASATSAAGVSVLATGVIGQRKQSLERRAPLLSGAAFPDAVAGLRSRDVTYIGEDKRPSVQQAQNRSEFFKALRKKAAGNGSVTSNKSDTAVSLKSDVINLREAEIAEETVASVGSAEENNVGQNVESLPSKTHNNGGVQHNSPGNGLMVDEARSLVKESSALNRQEGNSVGVLLPGVSEEEETAFMRSLGWEENAEGSELTEEEINAFYQMRDRKKSLSGRGHHRSGNLCVEHRVCQLKTISSGQSSSDSESDDEQHV